MACSVPTRGEHMWRYSQNTVWGKNSTGRLSSWAMRIHASKYCPGTDSCQGKLVSVSNPSKSTPKEHRHANRMGHTHLTSETKWSARTMEINVVIRWRKKDTGSLRITETRAVTWKRENKRKEADSRSQIGTHCRFPLAIEHTLAVYKLLLIWADDQEVQL